MMMCDDEGTVCPLQWFDSVVYSDSCSMHRLHTVYQPVSMCDLYLTFNQLKICIGYLYLFHVGYNIFLYVND